MTILKTIFLNIIKKNNQRRFERKETQKTTIIKSNNYWSKFKWQLILNACTVLVVILLLLTVPSFAASIRAPSVSSISTISYQGQLTDSYGNPLTGLYEMIFRIYDVPTEGSPLWSEMWIGDQQVEVSGGLFNVMLGSIDDTIASSIAGYDELYLGITVGSDSEMVPRVQLGSVPFSMQALTVPDGSITTEKIKDKAITQAKLGSDVTLLPPSDSITTTMIANGAVTQIKAPQLLKSVHRQDRIIDDMTQTNQYLTKGWGCWGPTDGSTTIYTKQVTFPITYVDIPIVVLSIAGDFVDYGTPPTTHGGVGLDMSFKPIVAPLTQSPSGFSASLISSPVYPAGHYSCFTWMAVGTLVE
ncbi:MAG: hypothetical protein JXA42_24945 [Anaerolineales bacterium]|nr:hypothetical protein [Anaerolineales bacterium]